MELPFEIWIKENRFSTHTVEILSDAISCYKNGINRAALLLSYIAFLNILRDRLLIAERPKSFPQGKWDLLQRNVVKDESWERSVFDATQKKDNKNGQDEYSIFSINESIRKQIAYWKDRRNDCAHFKDNHIDAFHVDAFWAFLKSNLSKITVEGGMQSLLNKIKVHFDTTSTPSSKDETPLIKEIEYSVEKKDLADFWGLLFLSLGYNEDFESYIPKILDKFIEKLIETLDDEIRQSLLDFIQKKRSFLHTFLSNHPSRIIFFCREAEQIRKFWNVEINSCDGFLEIYAAMLNANLIPDEELIEANEYILQILDAKKEYKISYLSNLVLRDKGFTDKVENFFFTEEKFSSYKYINDRAALFCTYLLINEFTPRIVRILCAEGDKKIYFSQHLIADIKRLFTKNTEKKSEFIEIAKENNIDIPEAIIAKDISMP